MRDCGIIFDCDGTLVDSLEQALEAFNFALQKVNGRPYTADEIKKYFGAGADRIFMSILGDQKKADQTFEVYLDRQTELANTTHLHTGVSELLENLKAANIPIGLVTGRHTKDLHILLRPHGLASYFKVMIADSDLARSKPAPDGILMAAKAMNLDPRRVFYVGDSASDILAAQNAGAWSIAALWDKLADQNQLRAAHPDHLAQTPAEVIKIFDAQLKNL